MHTIYISGATIVDGSGCSPYRGELLLQGTKIAAAGPRVEAPSEAEHIDAAGLYAAPGFIDAHSHLDLAPFLERGPELTLYQGISTAVVGQCGFSPAPMPPERQAGWERYSIIAASSTVPSWRYFADYLTALKQSGSAINLQPFVGHGTLRYAVKGDDPSSATADERRRMTALLEEAVSDRRLTRALAYVIRADAPEEESFFDALIDIGFETHSKEIRTFGDGTKKADWDVGMSLDAVSLAPHVDTIVLSTGDGDFARLCRYLKHEGVRVEVMAFGESTADVLVEAAHDFTDLSEDTDRYLL